MKQRDYLIIGAGMAGLSAARRLVQDTASLVVLDKGRGVGGRVATRRLGEARADHGAACFRWEGNFPLEKKALTDLALRPAPTELEVGAWTCDAGMNAVAKAMAQGLPVELQQTVAKLEYKDKAWICQTKEGQILEARRVLLTSPLWQSAEFFTTSNPQLKQQIHSLAGAVDYEPQWCLIIKLSGAQVRGAVYQPQPHPDIHSIFDQGRKGLPHAAGVLVVQASPTFSQNQLEADAAQVASHFTQVLSDLGWNMQAAEVQAHRWRYARVKKPLDQPFVSFDNAKGLCLAGDFCLGSSVHKATASGWAAAEALLKLSN